MSSVSLLDILRLDNLALSIFDIGARYTEGERYAPLVGRPGIEVTGFEPDPAQRKILETRYPGHRYLPHFVGDGSTRTFFECYYGGCSSLYEPDPAIIDQFTSLGTSEGSQFEVVNRHPVDTVRLDDVDGIGDCHYLKIDVQGAELDVLRGAEQLLAGVLVAEMEVEFVPLYKDQPLFSDVDAFMRARGFMLHRLVDLSGRAFRPFMANDNPASPVSQLLWADAVYIPEFRTLESLENDGLLHLSLLLHDLYLSVDLCGRLLAIYDDRNRSDLHEIYLGHIAAHGVTIPFASVKDWTE
ncbi:MAG: FkbM family methyltransferase [Proteobacteria bacterium]|nr:FkbM family methyltransferase [Pseudomonadota bacterium]